MKPKPNRESWIFSAGLWLAYWGLEALFGVDSTHALMLVLIGVLAWFVLYLLWVLPSPEEPRWKTYLRITVVMCVTLGGCVLSNACVGHGQLGRTWRILCSRWAGDGLGESTDPA